MIGYKALDKDMKDVNGNKMTYELNKEYKCTLLKPKNKWHYLCASIAGIEAYTDYTIKNCRVFLVDTLDGKINSNDNLLRSNKIKLIRELSIEELDYSVLEAVGKQDNIDPIRHYALDVLDDDIYDVRKNVAHHSYDLDVLDDDIYDVRKNVASNVPKRD